MKVGHASIAIALAVPVLAGPAVPVTSLGEGVAREEQAGQPWAVPWAVACSARAAASTGALTAVGSAAHRAQGWWQLLSR